MWLFRKEFQLNVHEADHLVQVSGATVVRIFFTCVTGLGSGIWDLGTQLFCKNKGIRDAGSTADFRILFKNFEILEIFDFFETFLIF